MSSFPASDQPRSTTRLAFTSIGITVAALPFGLLTGAGAAHADNSSYGGRQNAHTAQTPRQTYSTHVQGWQFDPRSDRKEDRSNMETPANPYPDAGSSAGRAHP